MKIEQWIQDILKDIPENKWVNISCQIRKDGDSVYIDSIKSLPQIDIVWEIEKMIEEYENEQKRISKWSSLHYDLSMYIKTLQELLQKFKS